MLTFDKRWKRAEVKYAERLFTLDEPCDCDLLVGMHPDGATRVIVEYAARHGRPFAVVPCCSDNGMSYKPWMRHLAQRGGDLGLEVVEESRSTPRSAAGSACRSARSCTRSRATIRW